MRLMEAERWLLEKMAELPSDHATMDLGRPQYQSLVDKGYATRLFDDGWAFLKITGLGRAALAHSVEKK